MADQLVGMGVLRVVPPAQLDASIKAADEERAALQDATDQPVMTNLISANSLELRVQAMTKPM